MSTHWVAPLAAIATGLVFFAVLWTGITRLLAGLSGWGRLAERFSGGERPTGPVVSGQILGMGKVRENNVTRVILTPSGMYLFPLALFNLGRPPLLIPYSQIKYGETRRILWSRSHTIIIAGDVPVTIRDGLLTELKSRGVSVPSDALA